MMAVGGMDLIIQSYSAMAIRELERATSRKREGVSLQKSGECIADQLR